MEGYEDSLINIFSDADDIHDVLKDAIESSDSIKEIKSLQRLEHNSGGLLYVKGQILKEIAGVQNDKELIDARRLDDKRNREEVKRDIKAARERKEERLEAHNQRRAARKELQSQRQELGRGAPSVEELKAITIDSLDPTHSQTMTQSGDDISFVDLEFENVIQDSAHQREQFEARQQERVRQEQERAERARQAEEAKKDQILSELEASYESLGNVDQESIIKKIYDEKSHSSIDNIDPTNVAHMEEAKLAAHEAMGKIAEHKEIASAAVEIMIERAGSQEEKDMIQHAFNEEMAEADYMFEEFRLSAQKALANISRIERVEDGRQELKVTEEIRIESIGKREVALSEVRQQRAEAQEQSGSQKEIEINARPEYTQTTESSVFVDAEIADAEIISEDVVFEGQQSAQNQDGLDTSVEDIFGPAQEDTSIADDIVVDMSDDVDPFSQSTAAVEDVNQDVANIADFDGMDSRVTDVDRQIAAQNTGMHPVEQQPQTSMDHSHELEIEGGLEMERTYA